MTKSMPLWQVWALNPAIARVGPSLDFLFHKPYIHFFFLRQFSAICNHKANVAVWGGEPTFSRKGSILCSLSHRFLEAWGGGPREGGDLLDGRGWEGPGKRNVSSGIRDKINAWINTHPHRGIFSKLCFSQGLKDQNCFLKNNKKETAAVVSFDTSPISWLSQYFQITCVSLRWDVSFPLKPKAKNNNESLLFQLRNNVWSEASWDL